VKEVKDLKQGMKRPAEGHYHPSQKPAKTFEVGAGGWGGGGGGGKGGGEEEFETNKVLDDRKIAPYVLKEYWVD
jgi:hypothetical protein